MLRDLLNQKYRLQMREKRNYVDLSDKYGIEKVKDGIPSYQLRRINTISEQGCREYHDMFVKFIDKYNVENDQQLTVGTSYMSNPKAQDCIIFCRRKGEHYFYTA